MHKKNPNILILGAKGMLGRTVFKYLKTQFSKNTWGTDIYNFNAHNHEKDFKKLVREIKKINYVINCIGIVDIKRPLEELVFINSLFPHILERYAEKYKFNLIHVSTDAVFPKLAGVVNEKSKPLPEDMYEISKLLGETTSQKAITIRSSFLGFNPDKRHGLLEWANQQSDKNIEGYVNQAWSGCTTLQFAMLCEWIIFKYKFISLRNFSKIIHFSPIESTKYKILESFSSASKISFKLKKVKGERITRRLTSVFFDFNKPKMYTKNIQKALEELVNFENDNTYKK